MTAPNFFIVGAPRCGTTALSSYLGAHPAVFHSEPKEPHFFATDFPGHRAISDLDTYLGLFSGARPDHRAVGESSVFYLYSRMAISNIRAFNPDARIIVMLRNPVDISHSLHAHLLVSFYESEPDFSKAWRLMRQRASGTHLPSGCPEPALLQYEKLARLGEQVDRLLAVFPTNQVHTVLFDDFRRSPRDAYSGVLTFLGVEDDGRTAFPVVNDSRQHRVRWVGRLSRPAGTLSRSLGAFRRRLGLGRLGVLDRLYRSNVEPRRRTPLPDPLRRELTDIFREDVERLSRLIGRDLSHWNR